MFGQPSSQNVNPLKITLERVVVAKWRKVVSSESNEVIDGTMHNYLIMRESLNDFYFLLQHKARKSG